MKTKEIDFEKLQFIRIFDPVHIPRELIDQVRDKKFSTDIFYKYQSIVCISETTQGKVINPLNLLFVIVNEAKKVIGFLWALVTPLTSELVINTFSMNKEYWGNGKAVELLVNKCKEIMTEANLQTVYWITNYPKHSERHGFKRSKGVLMEYKLGEDTDGRHIFRERSKADRPSKPIDSSTKPVSGVNTESDSAAS